jgi:hypothetical protein
VNQDFKGIRFSGGTLMNTRLLRRALLIWGICLLAALGSTAQTRRAARIPGAKRAATIPLSPATIASLANVAVVNVPWFDDMESGAPGWTSTGFWHNQNRPQQISVLSPTINPDLVTLPDAGSLPAPYSGNFCWWYGEASTGTFIGSDFDPKAQTPLNGGTSAEANSGNLITPPISLVGQTHAVLSFWTWWEIEGVQSNAFDIMSVEASDDSGVTWSALGRGQLNPLNDPSGDDFKPFSSNGLGQRGSWTQQFFDLTAHKGKTVLIRFNFNTGDDQFNGFRGWFIDNVSVTGGTLPAPAIVAVTPSVVNPSFTPVVSIIGANFVSGATIKVDSNVVSGGVLSSTVAQFDPTGLAAGSHGVTIINPDLQSASKIRSFVVSTANPPQFVSVQPDSAPSGVSAPIMITGLRFQAGVSVSIGGVIAPVQKVFGTDSISARTPATLPVGKYNIVVANPDSLSDIGVLAFNVTPFVYHTGDSVVGKAQGLKIAPVDPIYTSGKLFYRIAGKSPYDSVALTGSAGNFSVSLPASVVTIRGVEYYVTLSTVQGLQISYPSVTPALSPAFFPMRVDRIFPPVAPVATKYKMFSAPMALDRPSVMTQLQDDYGTYNPAQWRVFRWVRNGYRELVPFTGLSLDPGNAFWIVTASGTPFSFKKGVSIPTGQPYYVTIDTGWNQIGNPFGFNVAWSQVVGAESSGLIYGPYFYDGTQYKTVLVVEPYEGYFVYNGIGGQITLPFPPIETAVVNIHKEAASIPASGEFILQLSGAIPGTDYRDSYNFIGFRAGATAGRDRLDAPKPPPIGDGVQVNILDGGLSYLENYKPASGEGSSWLIDVHSTVPNGNAVLTLTPAGTLPPGYSVHVLDLKDENALPSASGTFQVVLDGPNSPHYYKVIMGTNDYASKESGGIPLQPVSFGLSQNYPNPFNPSTTIRYSLAKRSDVVLEIYNTIGQRIRTLFSGSQTTGEYAAVWDGTTDNGGHVASGVYFYRLRTGDFTAVRKLVMIR